MKLLVMSDTHHYLEPAREVLRRIGSQMDMVLHLGDHDLDAMTLQEEFSALPFHYVLGNNDYSWETPSKKLLTVCGKKLLMTHGHKQQVYFKYDNIAYWAEEQGADVVLFGHTHRPVCDDTGRVMLFNPGSISMPRGSKTPTFGILTITENGRIEGAIMAYHPKDPFHRLQTY